MASFILWQKELDSDDDVTESERVVKASAKLIRSEIREFDYSCVNYPFENDICDPKAGGCSGGGFGGLVVYGDDDDSGCGVVMGGGDDS